MNSIVGKAIYSTIACCFVFSIVFFISQEMVSCQTYNVFYTFILYENKYYIHYKAKNRSNYNFN